MAKIGLSKPYIAVYSASGSTVSYSSGSLLGKAVSLDLSLNGGNKNVLYADNAPAESDNQFGGGTLKVKTDDLDASVMKSILGLSEATISDSNVTTSGAKWLKYDDSQNVPYCGFGGIVKKKMSGVNKYVAVVFNKVQFSNPALAVNTQGETIEWQTSELEATILRDDSTNHTWRMETTPLDTEAEAEACIKSALGIS